MAAVLWPISGAVYAASPVPRTAPVSGQVVAAKAGEDIVFVSDRAKADVALRQDLKAGDVLSTNAQGALSIVFADQTQVRLGRNTVLEVKAVSKGAPSEINIKSGSLWARAPRGKSRLAVSTPTATAAIRGTEWAITVSPGETRLQVASGEVEFFNPQGRLSITSGQAASAQAGQAPVRTVIVNRGSREQMLYYLPKKDVRFSAPALQPAYDAAYAGDLDRAESLLRTAPASANAGALLAKIGFLKGDADLIQEGIDIGYGAAMHDPHVTALDAEYQAAYLGRPETALTLAQDAAVRSGGAPDILLTLSRIQLERRQPLAAMQTIERAIAAAPDMAELYVQKADIHLSQNRPALAEAALQTAYTLAPEMTAARLTMGQVYALRGQDEAAFTEFLAASADNPGYAQGLLRLAESYGRAGETELAEQQLDAADRLDPNSPFTPLYRTALALHNYESSAAIDGAQDALARFQARGGIYENLSENRETGSNVSRAFRFNELEAWGRYYGDRTFDTFTATSYFDATINETPGPFLIRREDTSFNPQAGDDLDRISLYLQGVTLDPLSVASSERDLHITRESFLEGMIGGSFIKGETSELQRGEIGFQGRAYTAPNGKDIPVAFSLTGRVTSTETDAINNSGRQPPQEINRPDQTRDITFLEGYFGARLSARDNLVFFGTYRDDNRLIQESIDLNLQLNENVEVEEKNLFGFGFWNHEFGDRNALTIGAGYGQTDNLGAKLTQETFGSLTEVLTESNEALYLTATYAHTIAGTDVKFGAEGYWNNVNPTVFSIVDIPGIGTSIQDFATEEFDRDERRVFLDARREFKSGLIAQGQIAWLNEYDTAAEFSARRPDRRDSLTYNLGVAYEPIRGQWLRGGITKSRATRIPFTLAPITFLGLKGALVPTSEGALVESRIARWDSEWTDWLFTSAEYQNQKTGRLFYRTPDGEVQQTVDSTQIDQYRLSVNALFGRNITAHANYTLVNSEVTSERLRGARVSFVPDSTFNAGLVWTNRRRLFVELSANYVGNQVDFVETDALNPTGPTDPEVVPIDGFFTADIQARWEPFDKRFEFKVGILNIFDNDQELAVAITSPGRTLFASVAARF